MQEETKVDEEDRRTPRRVVLLAAGAGVAGLVGGCATYGVSSPQPVAQAPTGEPTTGEPVPATGEPAPALALVSEIPVGGGRIFVNEGVVLTQPTGGDIKGFSAVCTHAGCTVSNVVNGAIVCPCHNSRFAIADGSVTGGPAPAPLPAVAVTVDGDAINLA